VPPARLFVLAVAILAASGAQTPAPQAREDAYRANNIGVALLEQFNYASAADSFRTALAANPALALARVNLAIALLYLPDLDAAVREATEAARLLPRDAHPPYVLGLVERARGGREAQARAAFERVLQIDPRDVGAQINLGQLDLQQQQYAQAVDRFRAALADEPYSVTAMYNLGLALTRAGRRDEGVQAMERSQALRAGGYGIVFSANYLEQGSYAEAVASTGAEADLVDRATPDVTFTPTVVAPAGSESAADSSGGGLALADFDGDGDLDILVVWPGGVRLLRNTAGRFSDATAASGLTRGWFAGAVGAVAGDYDNDGRPDVLVLRKGGNLLLHNDGGGKFSDATAAAGLPAYASTPAAAAFVDFDHDGDLDLVIAGDAPLQLVRNNGNRTFTNVTERSGIGTLPQGIAVAPTDYDNHRDIDLLVARRDGSPALLKNLRDGTFRDAAPDAGLRVEGRVTSIAVSDVNKDDLPDFFFGRAGAPGLFAMSDGRGRFTI
jgi:Tfp pilus assembly protein PilF